MLTFFTVKKEDIRYTMADRAVDIAWLHGIPLSEDKKKSKCNYCGKVLNSGGATRLKQHLAGGYKDVAKCPNVPYEIQKGISKNLRGGREKKAERERHQREFDEAVLERPGVEVFGGDDSGYNAPPGAPTDFQSEAEWRTFQMAVQNSRQSQYFENLRTYEQARGAGGSGSAARHAEEVEIRGERRRSTRQNPAIPRPPTRPRVHSPDPILEQDPTIFRQQDAYQPTIPQALGTGSRQDAARDAFSKFVFYNGIPPHVAQGTYYHAFLDAAGRAGAGWKGPTPYELLNKFLPNLKELEEYIETLKPRWETYGVTIMADGWTGPTRQSIINFMVSCNGKTFFLKSLDASAIVKDADYLYKELKAVVLEVGPQNVIQIVTDNGTNFKKAGEQLMKKKSKRIRLFWTPCAAHSIDLMLKDMGKKKIVESVVRRARQVTTFVYNHGYALAMLRERCNGDLVRPGVTRFATNYIALKSFQTKVVGLRAMFASDQWFSWRGSNSDEGKAAQETIASDTFWRDLTKVVGILEPVVSVLKMVDTERKPTLAHIYAALQKMKEMVRIAIPRGASSFIKIIDERWEKHLDHPLHKAAYYLNPRYQYSHNLGLNVELLKAVQTVVEKLEPNPLKQAEANNEIQNFREANASFGRKAAVEGRQTSDPADWWVLYGIDSPNLRKIAVRILAQTSSSSGCERNWSTFSMIHTKRRNRLGHERLQQLVYVHYNMRLKMKHIRDGMDPKENEPLELSNIFQEDSDDEEDPLFQWVRDRGAPEMDQPGGRPDPTIATVQGTDVEEYMSEEGRVHSQSRRPFEATVGSGSGDGNSGSGDDDGDGGGNGDDPAGGGMQSGGYYDDRHEGMREQYQYDLGTEPATEPTRTGESQFQHATQDQDHGPVTYHRKRRGHSTQSQAEDDDMSMQTMLDSFGTMTIDTTSERQSWHSSQPQQYDYGQESTGSEYSGYGQFGYGQFGQSTHEFEIVPVPTQAHPYMPTVYQQPQYDSSGDSQYPSFPFPSSEPPIYPRIGTLAYVDDYTYMDAVTNNVNNFSSTMTWEEFAEGTGDEYVIRSYGMG